MKSKEDELRKHFESLPTDSLITVLSSGGSGYDSMIRDVLRKRGISSEDLSKKVSQRSEYLDRLEESAYMQGKEDRQEQEVPPLSQIIEMFFPIIVIALVSVILLIIFYFS